MDTHGFIAPETERDAKEAFEEVGPAARTVTSEVAKAMGFERGEYREMVTDEVVATAQEAFFASLLSVHVGPVTKFESWLEDTDDMAVHLEGNENVDRRSWHPVYPADAVAAVTFHDEPEAAVATVRRQAFGRFYRSILDLG